MKQKIEQAVILAGGKGERLKPFTDKSPKPMYPVQGVPFINRLVEQVKSFGINEIVLLLGYMADQVVDELGDGSKFGVKIVYDITPVEYDTGDRLKHAENLLKSKFLLMYCDNYCPIDFEGLVNSNAENGSLIQLSVYSNKDGYTKNNLIVEEDGRVSVYDKKRVTPNLQGVDIGYALVDKCTVEALDDDMPGSFAKVYPQLVEKGKLYATVTDHRYYSIGGFERMPLTEEFFKNKKAVFLDRDGTINVRAPKACYIEKPEDFVWLDGAIDAIKMLNDHGVIIILVSNQPGIARGNMTEEDLQLIHDKMNADLAKAGAKIDHIYYCPHGWDEGCDCRKPNPGMLYMAQRDLSLNIENCILFGDDERDIEAADRARCKSELITEDYPLIEAVKKYIANL